MKSISRNIRIIYSSNLLRKFIHLILSLTLLVPFTQSYRNFVADLLIYPLDPTLLTITILLFVASFINSLQIRIPNLRDRFMRISGDLRKKLLSGLELVVGGSPYAEIVENIDKVFSRYEEKLLELVSSIERDYELRYGYICITFALISIAISYMFFGSTTVYGILALGIVDTVSSIISMSTQKRRKILKHTDVSIVTTFTVFTSILYILNQSILYSVVLGLIAVIVELLSPEDNLMLPIAVTLVAYIMNVPAPII